MNKFFSYILLSALLLIGCEAETVINPDDPAASTSLTPTSMECYIDDFGFANCAGTVQNNTQNKLEVISITISGCDENGFKVSDAVDYIDSLNPGQVWKFNAGFFEEGMINFEVTDLTAIESYE